MTDPSALVEPEVQSGTSLRRSKRNKYHLDVAAMLKSGSSSSRRDYSPPSKKWATRRPTTGIQQQPKMASSKRAVSKMDSLPMTVALAVREEEAEEDKAPNENGDAEEIVVAEGEEGKAKGYCGSRSSAVSGTLPRTDIQLPEQLLEEDACEHTFVQEGAQSVPPEQSSTKSRLGDESPAADGERRLSAPEQPKRKRKVPLKHLDYTNGDDTDDQDEELLFRGVKVEYTLEDGTKTVNDHSCPKCPAIFESRVGLTNHLKLHGSRKEFPCELCDFSCTNKKTMRQHRRVHGLSRRPRGKKAKYLAVAQLVIKKETLEPVPSIQPISPPLLLNHSRDNLRTNGPKTKQEFGREAKEEEEGIAVESLEEDQNGSGEDEEEEDGEGMPILEQQEESQSASGRGTPNSGNEMRRRKGRELPIGFYKKGSKIYDRNTVRCPLCPFRTQSKTRLEPHMAGHNRSNGFTCSLCLFKSESSGFLRRHCQLHKEPFKWPPDYSGIAPSKEAAEEECVDVAPSAADATGPLFDETTGEGGRRELDDDGPAADTSAAGDRPPAATLGGCRGRKSFQMSAAILYRRWGPLSQRTNRPLLRRLKNAKWTIARRPLCRRCGLLFNSGPGALVLHRNVRHRQRDGGSRRAICEQFLAERLSRRPMIRGEFAAMDNSNSPPQLAANEEGSPNAALPPEASKMFRCQNCPFTTDQIFRLQKHVNKHFVRAEQQCSHCSFSCRSMDILSQHLRLHDKKAEPVGRPPAIDSLSPALAVVKSQQQNPADEAPKLVAIRRNETHYCPHCPYHSKHNCDMKAHLKMHEVRRKFSCNHCSYSTMRQNALLAHEKLHLKAAMVKDGCNEDCRILKKIYWSTRSIGGQQRERGTLLGHRLQLVETGGSFYRCAVKDCSAEFPFCFDLAKHGRHHLKQWTDGKRFECGTCGFQTDLEERERRHELVHQSGEEARNTRSVGGVFQCKECPYSTANYAKFWNHRQKHKRASRFACPQCSFSSGSSQCYYEHMKLHKHSNQEEGVNDESGKTEREENLTLESHTTCAPGEKKKNDNGGEAIMLKQQKSTASSNSSLAPLQKEQFERVNAALPVKTLKQLGLIGKPSAVGETDSLSTGSTSSSSSKTPGTFKRCAECPYKTTDSVLLKLHAEMHRKGRNRPFLCTLCSFGCFSAESLHSHLSLHTSTSAIVFEGSQSEQSAAGGPQQKSAGPPYNHFCSQCNFKCAEREQFLAHRKEHVQLLQQRLMTIIKRSTNENGHSFDGARDKLKLARSWRIDKQHYCPKCSFRCDSVQAFTLHWEHHKIDKSPSGIFKCNVCDYSSNTKNVVIFHERNHHLDVPLTSLCLSVKLSGEAKG